MGVGRGGIRRQCGGLASQGGLMAFAAWWGAHGHIFVKATVTALALGTIWQGMGQR